MSKIISVLILYVILQISEGINITCDSFENSCGKCIGFAGARCIWCSAPQDISEKRCQTEDYKYNTKWCKKEYIVNPEPINEIMKQNDEFSPGTPTIKPVQFRPQHLKIKMRPGVPFSFDMSYKPAKHFPLDVYYLMDHSYTMRPQTKILQQQGRQLLMELEKFTNNVQFGVGSFVEKPAFPFANPNIHIAYSFKNHLKLTKNMSMFEEVLMKIPEGSNYDDPEAGLDALMQVMKCEKELGWRPVARRIIVLCTDNTYHSAGDGKMVGAAIPNDMKCHLDSNGHYDSDLKYDYPSVTQINRVASKGAFLIIFAAVNTVKKEYEALKKSIQGSNYVEFKEKSNIVDIIKKEYLKSVEHTQINYDRLKNVELTLDPDCSKEGICRIKHNESLTMKATLEVKNCSPNNTLTMQVNPINLKESLTIEIGVVCECDCEKHGSGEMNSKRCNSAGTLQCGLCNCYDGRYGDKCQCFGNSTSNTDLDKCKLNVSDVYMCSGRGVCRCGECTKCVKGFSGDFCQFDDKACERVNGKLCADRGVCRLGRCECDAHWTGNDCSCPEDDSDCIAPYSKEVCSGNGKCHCGECSCNKMEGKDDIYGGTFCDHCDDCTEKRCQELGEYIHCVMFNNKTYCDQIFHETETVIDMVSKTDNKSENWNVAQECNKALDNGTVILFRHYYEGKKIHFLVQKELDVLPVANIWVAVGSSIGAVLLIGLLTGVIWKILIDIHDKKEYAKFASEAQAQGFVVSNPWYRSPANNFSNPAFNNN
ncbi:integrin beta-PS-like [Galleria mellonella]|uniref:Integrin beta n=1 Tax=Galleria mellonella TaxID=7137 RepID=A0A6J1WPS2_GALME|nr:integrin beta-PS-like [Galleria mellonella]